MRGRTVAREAEKATAAALTAKPLGSGRSMSKAPSCGCLRRCFAVAPPSCVAFDQIQLRFCRHEQLARQRKRDFHKRQVALVAFQLCRRQVELRAVPDLNQQRTLPLDARASGQKYVGTHRTIDTKIAATPQRQIEVVAKLGIAFVNATADSGEQRRSDEALKAVGLVVKKLSV